MNTFLDKGFFISMFYEEDYVVKLRTLVEIN